MPIVFSVIARGSVVLAESSSDENGANFAQVVRKVLVKIQTNPESRLTYLYDGWIFNFLMHNKHFFFCMTDQQFGRVIPFTYLKDLSQDFFAKYPEEATSYDGLTDLLTSKMSYYNNKELENKGTAGQQKIEAINKQLDGVKDVMKTNLEKALERGERIEVLETRTQELSASAQAFKIQSKQLSTKMWCQNMKTYFIGFGILLIIGLIVLFSTCGFTFSSFIIYAIKQ